MKKLLITFLGVAFVLLNATSAQATSSVVPNAVQLTEKPAALQEVASGSFIKTAFNTFNRDTAPGARSVDAAASAVASDASQDQWSRNGLSMLAALVIIAGIVLRRFLR